MYTYSVSGYDVNNKVSPISCNFIKHKHCILNINILSSFFHRNLVLVRSVQYVKFCKPNRVAVSRSQRNHFVAICGLRVMNSVMPDF